MRWIIIIISFIFFSCREIIPVEPEVEISGYQINGFVTNQSGTPLENVDVKLYYETEKFSNTQVDTNRAVVTDTGNVVLITVVNFNNFIIKKLFEGKKPLGEIGRIEWNGEIREGVFAPAGMYIIRTAIDGDIKRETPVLIEGTITATTDSNGFFIIPNSNLPVGKLIEKYDLQDRYLGTFHIVESVILELFYNNVRKLRIVDLQKNKVTRANITI